VMMAAWRALDLLLIVCLPLLMAHFFAVPVARYALALVWLRVLWRFYVRVAKSNFSALDCALSVFAVPLFCVLLLRSWWQHTVRSEVAWKGRAYPTTRKL
jgi:hypothetical protein